VIAPALPEDEEYLRGSASQTSCRVTVDVAAAVASDTPDASTAWSIS
jgi:hypothetical protein